jgi:hypothetical protein
MPLFSTPDDVTQLQADIESQAKALTDSLSTCIAAGTITTRTPVWIQWKALVKRITRFLNEEPSWLDANSQVTRGHAIQRDCQPMYAAITAAGCTAPPAPTPPPPDPADPGSLLTGWGEIVGLALVAWILHEMK